MSQGNGIGLAGFCTSGWRIRYLAPPQDIVDRACDLLVKRGVIPAKTLTFYPAVGGQSVLLPMQRGTIQGFEYVNPYDDLVDFFPVKEATAAAPLGNPDAGKLDCSPALAFPDSGRHGEQLLAEHRPDRRALRPPSVVAPAVPISWMHIDKTRLERPDRRPEGGDPKSGQGLGGRVLRRRRVGQCMKLKAMLDFNKGINQRNLDGTRAPGRRQAGQCRDDDGAVAGRRLEGTAGSHGTTIWHRLRGPTIRMEVRRAEGLLRRAEGLDAVRASIGATKFDPGKFPGKTGLVEARHAIW